MKHLYLIALILFSAGFFLFAYAGISEQGYGKLLAMGITDAQNVYLLAFASVVISPVLVYFALRSVDLSEWKCMFGGLMLTVMPVALNNATTVADPMALVLMLAASFAVLAAGLVSKAMGNRRIGLAMLVIVAGAGIFIGNWDGVDYYVGEYSFLLPFSFALLLEGAKERREDKAGPPIIGAAALLFSHPVGAVVLACTSAIGLAEIWKEKERPLNLAFMAVFSLCLLFSQGNMARTAIAGLFGFIVFYVIAAMYEVKMRMLAQPAAIVLIIAAVLTMAANMGVQAYEGERMAIPSESTIEMYKWVREKGEVGIFAYPNAFRFYAGSEPVVLDPLGAQWTRKVIFTYDTLDAAAGRSMNVFAYFASATAQDGTEIAVFANKAYLMNTVVQGGRVDRVDGAIVGFKRIPFTKIKMLDERLEYKDKRNRLIVVEGIEGSVLAEGLKKVKEHSLPGAFIVGS